MKPKTLLNFRINPDIYARLKKQAARSNVTMTRIATEAIKEKLAQLSVR